MAIATFASTPAARAVTYADGPKLVGSAGASASRGSAVAASANGNTVIVGAAEDASGLGAALIFIRSAGSWSQQGAKLVGSGAALGAVYQGFSAALSSDGDTALIGGPEDDSSAGAAWVFTRSGGVWTQQGLKLLGTGGSGPAHQGYSVALSSDGNTALVGGPYDNSSKGAAWVFTRSGGVWTQQGGRLIGTAEAGNGFQGWSVALSSNGDTALIGGMGDNGGTGAAWVFTRSAGVWSQQGSKLVGTGVSGELDLGYSAALSSDGDTALVGAPATNSGAGGAWVFTRAGGSWTQQGGVLVGTGATDPAIQGSSVALSGDGNTALVGGPHNNPNPNKGAAWAFTRSGGVWTQTGKRLVGTADDGDAAQGHSVALSGDGTTAVVGGPVDNSGAGAVWIFMRTCTSGDASGDGAVDVSDVFYLINFLFAGGSPPTACF